MESVKEELNDVATALRERADQVVENLNIQVSEVSVFDEDVTEAKELFQEANVIDSCKKLADSYFQDAQFSLEHLKSEINSSEYEFFENLLDFVIKRDF